jgi:cysteine synthase
LPFIPAVSSTLQKIGNTPLIDVSFLSPNKNVKIFAKLESVNPSGSIKDRVALAMIDDAEKTGKLKKGSTIIEPTSGNTGISLAMVAKEKGYRFTAVMPNSMSIERRELIKSFGGELILLDADEPGVIREAERLAKEKEYFMPNQFENPKNPEVHYNALANEILSQIKNIDIFIAGIGTGGTITGTTKKLKEANPKTKAIAFYSNEDVQGTININKLKPKVMNLREVDEVILMNKEDSIETMKLLWANSIYVGMSSGATANIAQRKAKELKEGNIVVIFADSGNRYQSLFKETNKKEENKVS